MKYSRLNVKDLRGKIKISQQALSDETGIPKGRIAQWEVGNGNPKPDDLEALINFFSKKGVLEERHETKKVLKRIPFYDAEASAGNDVLAETTPVSAPAGAIDVGDLLRDSESAIRIYGNSMIPNYPPGCVVGLVRKSGDYIEPGEVYVVETRDSRLLKRLFYKDDDPGSNYITCYSDNILKFTGGARDGKLAYPPFDIEKSEIIALYTVTGVIKRNSNSAIIHRN